MLPHIRPARDSDIQAIASAVARYWDFENIPGFERPRTLVLLADFLAHSERGHCWIAEIGGDLVGYLLVVYVFSLEHGGMMAEIDEFFVLAEKRSLKIGTALLEAATAAMKQRGITQVQLQLGSNNSHGERFYEAHGFRRVSSYALWQKALN